MSVQVVKIMMVVLATVTFGMAGCGGGGGASTPAVVNTNTYSTAKENIRLYQVRKTYLPKLFSELDFGSPNCFSTDLFGL